MFATQFANGLMIDVHEHGIRLCLGDSCLVLPFDENLSAVMGLIEKARQLVEASKRGSRSGKTLLDQMLPAADAMLKRQEDESPQEST